MEFKYNNKKAIYFFFLGIYGLMSLYFANRLLNYFTQLDIRLDKWAILIVGFFMATPIALIISYIKVFD
jgi:hypothetical protein